MPLWGVSPGDEKQPNWLTAAQKKLCYADKRGWILKDSKGREEVLVAAGGLDGSNTSTGIGSPNIVDVTMTTRTANNRNIELTLSYNEEVYVTNAVPYIAITGNNAWAGGDGLADYASGNGTNQLVFTYVPKSGDDVGELVVANTITLNDALIQDANSTASIILLDANGDDSATDIRPTINTEILIAQDPYITLIEMTARSANAENVELTVTFSEAVDVAANVPYIALTGNNAFAGGDGFANYASGTGTDELVFLYEPASGDDVSTLLVANTITLYGSSTIKDTTGNGDAIILLDANGLDEDTDVRPDVSAEIVIVA